MNHRLPRRISLPSQVEEILVEGIRGRRWHRRLPGQRVLAKELQVGSKTLRLALAAIAKRKFIRIRHGYPCEIIVQARSRRLPTHPWRVGYMLPSPLVHHRPHAALIIGELREFVHNLGGQLDLHHSPKFYREDCARSLSEFVDQHPYDCWILAVSTRPMQQWFARHNLPVIVAGSVHEGIGLPSINLDYRGVGRHAAGLMVARGHRRTAFLGSNRGVPAAHVGTLEIASGFTEAIAASRRDVAAPLIAFHDGSPADASRALNRLLDLPGRPTALLVGDSATFLIILSHLARRRLIMPQDLSVIVVEDEPYFENIVPAPTHYEWAFELFLKEWRHLLIKVLDGTLETGVRVRIVPNFIAGGTLTRCGGN